MNMTRSNIQPQSISGFPEWLPEEKIIEQKMIDIIRAAYEKFGFSPIETAAVEKVDILRAKGGNDKEIYCLSRLAGAEEGEDGKELALHFDLTVPLARYVAQNYSNLPFPFRRYQIQKVWRGERPQSGRFREFYQCDIDIIGDGELSLLSDAEIPSIIYSIFKQMDIGPFVININNRKIIQGYLNFLGIPDSDVANVLRTIDKIEKVGVDKVVSELVNSLGFSEEKVKPLIDLISLDTSSTPDVINELRQMKVNDKFSEGVDELAKVLKYMGDLGVPDDYYKINISIARGLDYYTGTVYETILKNHPGIGSVCSGGRFDNLAGYFTDKKLPGVGISIGLTRLFSKLIKAEVIKAGPSTSAPVLVTVMDPSCMNLYFKVATLLRDGGINTEVFLENKKIGIQLKFANRKGFALAVIAGSNEVESGNVQLKNLKTGEQYTVSVSELVPKVSEILSSLKKQGLWV